jgi:hypothetical protein
MENNTLKISFKEFDASKLTYYNYVAPNKKIAAKTIMVKYNDNSRFAINFPKMTTPFGMSLPYQKTIEDVIANKFSGLGVNFNLNKGNEEHMVLKKMIGNIHQAGVDFLNKNMVEILGGDDYKIDNNDPVRAGKKEYDDNIKIKLTFYENKDKEILPSFYVLEKDETKPYVTSVKWFNKDKFDDCWKRWLNTGDELYPIVKLGGICIITKGKKGDLYSTFRAEGFVTFSKKSKVPVCIHPAFGDGPLVIKGDNEEEVEETTNVAKPAETVEEEDFYSSDENVEQ